MGGGKWLRAASGHVFFPLSDNAGVSTMAGMNRILLLSGVILASASVMKSSRAAEAFEAALGREAELPGGKEADGIRGDFVLRDQAHSFCSSVAPR